ncbi:MAG: Peptidase families and domain protein [Myxococcales bacterium]|nr:Peptidase families and domain protein [Myxococcales bacterium]
MRLGTLLALALLALSAVSCGSAPKANPQSSRATLNRDTAVADGVDEIIVTVTVFDQGGKPLAGALPHVELSGQQNLIKQSTGTDAQGIAYVRVATTLAETKTLTVTLPEGEVPTHLTAGFVAGPGDHLRFVVQPSTTMAGVVLSPPVRVGIVDKLDNQSTDEATITLASDTPFTGTATQTAASGVATFANLVLPAARTAVKLRASTPSLGMIESAPFDVVAGSAARLVFKMQPASTTAGGTMPNVIVEVQDAQGNRILNATTPVMVSLASGSGALGGTTKVNAAAGVASFSNLNVTKAGTFALAATGPGFAGDVSATFTVAPGPAATLGFTTPPAIGVTSCVPSTSVACSFPVQVAVTDTFGNAVPSAPATTLVVSLKAPAPNGATLTGGGSKTTAAGVASYTLSLDKGGVGMVLTVGGSVNGSGVTRDSAPFDVRHLVVVGNSGNMTFLPSSLTVKTGDTVRWTLASKGHTVVSGTGGVADGVFCGPAGAVVNAGTCQVDAALSKAGDTFEYTVPAAGAKSYFCSAHFNMGMTGTVTGN